MSGLASSVLVPNSVALVTTRLLMAPRLVNVQALILLVGRNKSGAWASDGLQLTVCSQSVLASQQDSQARSELLFAQACTLARAMELHAPQTAWSEPRSEERQERWKVCRSLYIRDKAFAVTRGSVSWMPDANINQLPGITNDQDTAFSCRTLLACGKGSQTVQQLAEVLILTAGCAYPPQSMGQMTELVSTATHSDTPCDSIPADASPATILALLDAFPPSAYFMMVREVLWPGQDGQIVDAEGGLWLLQQVQACYHEHAALMPAGSYRRKLGSFFQLLLRVVTVQEQQTTSTLEPSQGNTASGTLESSSLAQEKASSTLKAPQQEMEFEMPSFSAWPTPDSMQDPSWGNWAEFTSSGDVSDLLLLPSHPDGKTGTSGDLTSPEGRDQWMYSPPLEHGGRKRLRTEEHSDGHDSNAQRGPDNFMTSPEPFTFSITPSRI